MPTGKVKKSYYWVDIGYPHLRSDISIGELLKWCEEQFGTDTLPFIRSWLYFSPKERIYFRNEEDRTAFLFQWKPYLN